MGGGKSSNQTDQSTKVTTSTTTNIRDIGLTGNAATELAAILSEGNVAISSINADTVKTIVQEQGKSFQHLVGAAGDIVRTAQTAASDATAQAVRTTQGEDSKIIENMPLILLGGAAIITLGVVLK